MPEYEYRAKDGPERLIEGVLQAASEMDAVERISQMGYVPVSVRPRSGAARSEAQPAARQTASVGGALTRWRSSVPDGTLALFSRHLSSLIRSGVPILRGLTLLSEQERHHRLKAVLDALAEQIKRGSTLSGALRRHADVFPPTYIAMVEAGEGSGSLQEALARIAVYLRKQSELQSKVRRALAYPLFLSGAGAGSVIFLLAFVVPRLSGLFNSMEGRLPLPTRVILTAGNVLEKAWFPLIVLTAVLALVLPRLLPRLMPAGALDAFRLRLPLLGEVVFKADAARFCRTLEMSLSNGIAFVEALRVAVPTVRNILLRDALEEVEDRIKKGEPFGRGLRASGLFPPFLCNLVSIGEESGRLDEVLGEIADAYEQDLDEKTAFLTTLLEPAMILVVGSVIAFIVMGILLPIFEMNSGL
ncbi:MAG: Type II secretion system protein F [Candidatus Omnitrophica bacterium]|nr:Type II secretion system protein F [Candidatus Omnitrophota bacterium]